jgi:hypothetical protein
MPVPALRVELGWSTTRPEFSPQEIEVTALVGLEDVLEIQPAPAPRVSGRGRAPGGAAAGELGSGDVQLEAAGGDV